MGGRLKFAWWGRRDAAYVVSFMIIAAMFYPVYAQFRQVDQGRPGVDLTRGWPMRFCDSSGNCITLTLVGATYAVPVVGTGTFNTQDKASGATNAAVPANAEFGGGVVRTDTSTATAAGNLAGVAVDKWGYIVVKPAVQDMWATGTFTLTATTASTPTNLAAPGANYRFALTGVYACSTANALTRLDIRDNTTAVVPFVWVQTATTSGEPKCWQVIFDPPFLMTANQPITVALATAVTDVRGVISAYKTGT